MPNSQWEFCQLTLKSMQEEPRSYSSSESFDCLVRYISSEGDVIDYQLAELGQTMRYNPFLRAMGLLGGAEWELVSVDHGERVSGEGGLERTIRFDNRVAYFKRLVHPRRAVDEPRLK